jgi:L-lactate utilization protein LutC
METAWSADAAGLPELVPYAGPVETFKADLFEIDAGITSVRAGVADTGAVVLWPTPDEPRLMSLVPPVHVAVLDADTIYNSMSEMMAALKTLGRWHAHQRPDDLRSVQDRGYRVHPGVWRPRTQGTAWIR